MTKASPIIIISKNNRKLKVCIENRALNKATLKDCFTPYLMNNILEHVVCYAMS